MVAESVKEKKLKLENLDENQPNVGELNDVGMLDCWIVVGAAGEGIAQDDDAFQKAHRQLWHDDLDRCVVHGGVNPQKEYERRN